MNEKFIIKTLLLAVVGGGGGVGLAVGVAVGAAVGVVPVPVMEDAPPQPARSTRKPTASRHSQAFVVIGVDVFCISLPLLQCYHMNTAEDFLSPLKKITLPGYITYDLGKAEICCQLCPPSLVWKSISSFAGDGVVLLLPLVIDWSGNVFSQNTHRMHLMTGMASLDKEKHRLGWNAALSTKKWTRV